MCEIEITEKDLITAVKSMPNGKSLGHDALTKEFYEHFWDDLKVYNSLLNVDRKILCKLLAKKLKRASLKCLC